MGQENGVPVGPGRGSGAGSLVAYVQKITDLDPLEYDLLFERFLNPERVSMPDFDVDFCMDGRDRVIDYVAENYGREAVSQIITFGTMAAKAVVRDVARVQGKSYGLADRLSKMIPFEVGMTLEKAYGAGGSTARIPQGRRRGPRNLGHGASAGRRLCATSVNTPVVWLSRRPSSPTSRPLYVMTRAARLVTQFDKDDVEAPAW